MTDGQESSLDAGAKLRVEGIGKVFPGGARAPGGRRRQGTVRALEDVSFRARAGRILVLLGPSGCGKTTLLRIVAGLEEPDEGEILLDGRPLRSVPAGRRDVGFVFQSYALYPHLDVAGNWTLGLQARGIDRGEIHRRVGETARRLGLEGLLHRRPRELSGGQQQRVALGRALVKRPRLFLLDEPLSNLDARMREEMRGDLAGLLRRTGAVVLYVTHDQAEAMALADEIAVLQEGRMLQIGPPLDLYRRPASVFVAGFVGTPRMNLWAGEEVAAKGSRIALPEGVPSSAARSGRLAIGIRPEDVQVLRGPPEPAQGSIEASLEGMETLGATVLARLRTGQGLLVRALIPHEALPHENAWLRLPPDRLHLFDAQSGRRIP